MPPRHEGRDSRAILLWLVSDMFVIAGMSFDQMESSRGLIGFLMPGVVRLRYDIFEERPCVNAE